LAPERRLGIDAHQVVCPYTALASHRKAFIHLFAKRNDRKLATELDGIGSSCASSRRIARSNEVSQ
jgi:hypothetical protein